MPAQDGLNVLLGEGMQQHHRTLHDLQVDRPTAGGAVAAPTARGDAPERPAERGAAREGTAGGGVRWMLQLAMDANAIGSVLSYIPYTAS